MPIGQISGFWLLAQRPNYLLWVPVFLGIGIGVYFSLRFEPLGAVLWGGVLFCGMFWALHRSWSHEASLIFAVLGYCFLGAALAQSQTNRVAAPVLGYPIYGRLEGDIHLIDRSQSDALRLTLGNVQHEKLSPDKTPKFVRISLHDVANEVEIRVGRRIATKAYLMPPMRPVEPRGFDFRRHAWFQSLGAVGYARSAVKDMGNATPSLQGSIAKLRDRLSLAIRARIEGVVGGVASALITGDRAHVPKDVWEDLRRSNLAHLLAISGLHMGLLVTVVYGVVRFSSVVMARRWQGAETLASMAALSVALAYLVMSGASIATQRAFIMVAVMLVGIVVARRGVTIRAVAIAAIIILTLRPSSLLSPGFQMSFSATLALVACFRWVCHNGYLRRGILGWLQSLFLSSFVAGMATAPFAAAHFNQIVTLGLFANILTVPVVGIIVVPAGVLGLVLMPFGAEGAAFWIMGQGISWVLCVAHWISSLEYAALLIVSPPSGVLALLALSGLGFILLKDQTRWGFLLLLLPAAVLWAASERPNILIEDRGKLVGAFDRDEFALSRLKGQSFVADVWMENSGVLVSREMAFESWQAPKFEKISHLQGNKTRDNVTCDGARIIVAGHGIRQKPSDCYIFDKWTLRRTGAVAIWTDYTPWKIETVEGRSGTRPWTGARELY